MLAPVRRTGDGCPVTRRRCSVLGRPFPVFRGEGARRERCWGAVLDSPVEAGARVQLVAKSGKAWTATVAETVQTRGDGHLVTLRGAEWSADPDAPIAGPRLDARRSRTCEVRRARRTAGTPSELAAPNPTDRRVKARRVTRCRRGAAYRACPITAGASARDG